VVVVVGECGKKIVEKEKEIFVFSMMMMMMMMRKEELNIFYGMIFGGIFRGLDEKVMRKEIGEKDGYDVGFKFFLLVNF
jgi:hypothetical protein